MESRGRLPGVDVEENTGSCGPSPIADRWRQMSVTMMMWHSFDLQLDETLHKSHLSTCSSQCLASQSVGQLRDVDEGMENRRHVWVVERWRSMVEMKMLWDSLDVQLDEIIGESQEHVSIPQCVFPYSGGRSRSVEDGSETGGHVSVSERWRSMFDLQLDDLVYENMSMMWHSFDQQLDELVYEPEGHVSAAQPVAYNTHSSDDGYSSCSTNIDYGFTTDEEASSNDSDWDWQSNGAASVSLTQPRTQQQPRRRGPRPTRGQIQQRDPNLSPPVHPGAQDASTVAVQPGHLRTRRPCRRRKHKRKRRGATQHSTTCVNAAAGSEVAPRRSRKRVGRPHTRGRDDAAQ